MVMTKTSSFNANGSGPIRLDIRRNKASSRASPFPDLPMLNIPSVGSDLPEAVQIEPNVDPRSTSCVFSPDIDRMVPHKLNVDNCGFEGGKMYFYHWVSHIINLLEVPDRRDEYVCPLSKCRKVMRGRNCFGNHLISCRQLRTGKYFCPKHQGYEYFCDPWKQRKESGKAGLNLISKLLGLHACIGLTHNIQSGIENFLMSRKQPGGPSKGSHTTAPRAAELTGSSPYCHEYKNTRGGFRSSLFGTQKRHPSVVYEAPVSSPQELPASATFSVQDSYHCSSSGIENSSLIGSSSTNPSPVSDVTSSPATCFTPSSSVSSSGSTLYHCFPQPPLSNYNTAEEFDDSPTQLSFEGSNLQFSPQAPTALKGFIPNISGGYASPGQIEPLSDHVYTPESWRRTKAMPGASDLSANRTQYLSGYTDESLAPEIHALAEGPKSLAESPIQSSIPPTRSFEELLKFLTEYSDSLYSMFLEANKGSGTYELLLFKEQFPTHMSILEKGFASLRAIFYPEGDERNVNIICLLHTTFACGLAHERACQPPNLWTDEGMKRAYVYLLSSLFSSMSPSEVTSNDYNVELHRAVFSDFAFHHNSHINLEKALNAMLNDVMDYDLVTLCKEYLEVLEFSSGIRKFDTSELSINESNPYQVPNSTATPSHSVFNCLDQYLRRPMFAPVFDKFRKVVETARDRVSSGNILSLRGLELYLIINSKGVAIGTNLCERFAALIRETCRNAYNNHAINVGAATDSFIVFLRDHFSKHDTSIPRSSPPVEYDDQSMELEAVETESAYYKTRQSVNMKFKAPTAVKRLGRSRRAINKRQPGDKPNPKLDFVSLSCEYCPNEYTGRKKNAKANLNRHKIEKHVLNPRRFGCRLCPDQKTFSRKDNLTQHYDRVHPGELFSDN